MSTAKHDLGTKLLIAGVSLPFGGCYLGLTASNSLHDKKGPMNEGAALIGLAIMVICIVIAIFLVVGGVCNLIEGDREERQARKPDDLPS